MTVEFEILLPFERSLPFLPPPFSSLPAKDLRGEND